MSYLDDFELGIGTRWLEHPIVTPAIAEAAKRRARLAPGMRIDVKMGASESSWHTATVTTHVDPDGHQGFVMLDRPDGLTVYVLVTRGVKWRLAGPVSLPRPDPDEEPV